jgi:hypothetical protein
MSDDVLKAIGESPEILEGLWDLADFTPIVEGPSDWFARASGDPMRILGRDPTGGRFALSPGTPSGSEVLFYVGSEGEAGVIAPWLADGLRMMIALPSWLDCLKFSGGGDLEAMRQARDRLERDLQADRPEIDALRRRLFEALGLEPPDSPLEDLHRSVTEGTPWKVVNPRDGSEYRNLFNTFTVDDNPMWKS